MLITRRFVVLHFPKTGGTFLRRLCLDNLPREWLVECNLDFHSSYSEIPAGYRNLPVFALVRNPWDWYVSYYHHFLERERLPGDFERDSVWRMFFEEGRYTFEQAVRALCIGQSAIDEPAPWVSNLIEHDWDAYSYWWWTAIGSLHKRGKIDVGRFDRLREDFADFLVGHRIQVGDAFMNDLRVAPAMNVSRHDHYRAYYDDHLRDLVAHKARRMIRVYRFSF